MKRSRPKFDFLTLLMHRVAAVALFLMMLVVVLDVILRAVFNWPIRGAYDAVSIALLVVTMFGIAPVVAKHGEIVMDLMDTVFPPPVVKILTFGAALASIAVFLFFGWSMVAPAADAWQWGECSLELGIRTWIVWAVAFAGLVGILWACAIQLLAVLHRSRGDRSAQ